MATYQIDLGLLKESEETYRKSAENMDMYISGSLGEIEKVVEDVYSGDDAEELRKGVSSHIKEYFTDTKNMAVNMAQKISLAHSLGQLCKKRCYDFIFALGSGEGEKEMESFSGILYCNQERITILKKTCITAIQHGDQLKSKANLVKGLLDMLEIIRVDSNTYIERIGSSCEKIDCLEEYSIELTKYAKYVKKMDNFLQVGLKECIPEDYMLTADGVDDRQKYLDMEYDINELEKLQKISEEQLSDDDRARRDVLLLKQIEQETFLNDGEVLYIPEPGEIITISRGSDLPNQSVTVSSYHAWSKEYSVIGCNKKYAGEQCCRRLNYAIENYECNSAENDLLMFDIEGYEEPVFAGAMVEGYADIGDIVQATLDNDNHFYF